MRPAFVFHSAKCHLIELKLISWVCFGSVGSAFIQVWVRVSRSPLPRCWNWENRTIIGVSARFFTRAWYGKLPTISSNRFKTNWLESKWENRPLKRQPSRWPPVQLHRWSLSLQLPNRWNQYFKSDNFLQEHDMENYKEGSSVNHLIEKWKWNTQNSVWMPRPSYRRP